MDMVGREPRILELNSQFKQAHETMTVFEGQDMFLQEKEVTEFPKELLQHLIQGIRDIMERQLKDQLSGGIFWNPSHKLIEDAESCTAIDISGKRKFALMKAKQTTVPSMTTTTVEQKIMFVANKVKESFT